jgi:hypothetical protein
MRFFTSSVIVSLSQVSFAVFAARAVQDENAVAYIALCGWLRSRTHCVCGILFWTVSCQTVLYYMKILLVLVVLLLNGHQPIVTVRMYVLIHTYTACSIRISYTQGSYNFMQLADYDRLVYDRSSLRMNEEER